MPAYAQYCPVARALEVVGDRWSLLIVRDMLAGRTHFNAIERALPGISRAVLAQRLRQLEAGGVVQRHVDARGRASAYTLTSAGLELRTLLEALRDWGARWAFDNPRPDELDPAWLLTSLVSRRRPEALPPRRVIVEFRFRGGRRPHVWLVLDQRDEADICLKHPGFEPDLIVSADTEVFFRACFGRVSWSEAKRRGWIRCDGSSELWRALPSWFDWPSLPSLARSAQGASRQH